MGKFLEIIPADSLPTFLACLAVIVGAAVIWIGRKIGSFLEKLNVLKLDETKIKILDQVGDWAVHTTNQYFSKYLTSASPKQPTAAQNQEKLEYAIKQARLNLPEVVSEHVSDAQLTSVIEAKVATTKAATLPPPSPKITNLPE